MSGAGSSRPPGRGWIRWSGRFVPAARRDAWCREWEAESAHAWQELRRRGGGAFERLRLRARVASCIIDALWEGSVYMDGMGIMQDLRVALRGLTRHPAFTAITVLTLALGIGANTAVFTLVDGVLLSPLPFDRSEDLVSVGHLGRDGDDELPMSQGLYVLYREQARSIDRIGLHSSTAVNLVVQGEPERVQAQAVTPGFFEVLRVEAALGRTFTEAEGAPGGEDVVVIGHGLWRSAFGGDPGVLDRTLDVNGTARRIVGVMPADFGHPDREARLWIPMVVDPGQAQLGSFGAGGVARIAPGGSVDTVQRELEGLIGRLTELFPDSPVADVMTRAGFTANVRPLKEALVGDLSSTLWILLSTVGLVLLIACANVANLLLVRAESRSRELALRVTLGAGRLRVLRAFLGESLLLAFAGGVGGVLVAWGAVRLVLPLVPTDLPRIAEIGIDLRVLAFTGALALACAAFFGLLPMLRAGTRDLSAQLRDGADRGSTGSGDRHRLRSALVVGQVALALVLLVGSGLMLRSFQALRALDPGFEPERVLTARITVPPGEIEGWRETADFFRTLGERLSAIPGVEAVGFAAGTPLSSSLGYFNLDVEDVPRGPTELPILASHNFVEPGYFEAIGIDLLDGRALAPGDGAEEGRGVVVSRAFAERWWPGASALGRRLRLGGQGEETWHTVVGVVGDARYGSLEEPVGEVVYWPTTVGPADAPQPTRSMDVVIRTATDPLGFVGALRREVQELDPRIPIANPRTMEEVVRASTARTSFTMTLLGAASGIALLLGLVGIYGVVSYIVAQRRREIGVRMALGATKTSVRRMVVRQGFVLAGAGAVIGLLAAGAVSSLLDSILFGVSAVDPLTYGLVAAALVAVSVLATWIPATRAARVEPSMALRGD